MDMKKVNAGNLRAIGYDPQSRLLQVETTAGTFQYSAVPAEVHRRLLASSALWSFYRDNIEEEFSRQRIR